MRNFYISLILISFMLFAKDSKIDSEKPPTLKLGDNPLNLELDIGIDVADMRVDGADLLITDYEIEQIKLKAKNYIPEPITASDLIIMETNKGTMKLKFYNDAAPNHCLNFKRLANSGFYDGTLFHRVIAGFMIQGGDILSRDLEPKNDGMGGPLWTVDAEFNGIPHERGILSMARSRDINSAGSQFFICLDNAKHLDGNYTVFGYLVEGDHVLNAIIKLGTEHSVGIMLSKSGVPEGEDPSLWVEVIDPKTRKTRYAKVQEHMKNEAYQQSVQEKLNNTSKPAVPVIIKSVRVVNEDKE